MQYFKRATLELVVTNDRQYLIKSDKADFVYTNDRDGAESLLNLLLKIDWKKYETLKNYRDVNPEAYEMLAKEIRKYAVPKKTNGNYLTSITNGQVEYKLNESTMVKGIHLQNGVAYRVLPNGKIYLDLVYSSLPWMAFNDIEQIGKFIELTKNHLNFTKENLGQKIIVNPHYSEFVKSAHAHALNGNNRIVEIPVQEKAAFEYDLYINDGITEKRNCYIEAMVELNSLYGMKEIKEKVNQALLNREADQALNRVKVQTQAGLHSLYIGPAGTGKTQLARIMAKLYWSMGYIKENKLIEVSKEDLVSKYVGETEEKTEAVIEEAMNGVLFVDEAYTLVSGGNSENGQNYGKTALEIIMRKMENHRNELVVIFAGYEKEIESLLDVNQGLRSRFSERLEFENYSTKELVQISKTMLEKQGFNTEKIDNELLTLFDKKSTNGILKGNARAVRVLVDKIIKNHKEEIVKNNGSLIKISPNSVKKLYFSPAQGESEKTKEYKALGLKQLNSMIGLDNLKQKVTSWTNYLTIEMKRSQLTGETKKTRLHMTFEGSPGTGKTTVARLMGTILQGVGAIENGEVVEVVGKDLVAGYQGQTTPKVQELFKKAKGGILFIDEAYSIVKSQNDTFGLEAIDALITEMENKADEVVVILAGYTNEIERLLEINPGFESRIAERFLFEDYSSEELIELFKETLKKNSFKIECEALDLLTNYVVEEYNKEHKINGNGRWIRNIFEKIKIEQATRLVTIENFTEDDLFIMTYDDIKNVTQKRN